MPMEKCSRDDKWLAEFVTGDRSEMRLVLRYDDEQPCRRREYDRSKIFRPFAGLRQEKEKKRLFTCFDFV